MNGRRLSCTISTVHNPDAFGEFLGGGCLAGLRLVAQEFCGSEVGNLVAFYL